MGDKRLLANTSERVVGDIFSSSNPHFLGTQIQSEINTIVGSKLAKDYERNTPQAPAFENVRPE